MPETLVREFMSRRVLTMPPDATLPEVAASMSEARVSCVVVCDAQRVPIGVVTERDLTRAYARDAGRREAMPVGSAMSEGVFTLRDDATCAEAMAMVNERRVRRLVIVGASGALAGIITQTDLLRAHTEAIEVQRRSLEQRVQERTRELEALNRHLASLSRIDPLLGIGNRRAMDDELDRLANRCRRYGRPYSVALADVDHFKRFNDHYGHAAGDAVLKQVADCIADDIRAADAIFRYGGEEFLIVLPEVGLEGAAVAAEHVRRSVEALAIVHEESPFGQVTISTGVASGDRQNHCWNTMVRRADTALYDAKSCGRNRVGRCLEVEGVAA